MNKINQYYTNAVDNFNLVIPKENEATPLITPPLHEINDVIQEISNRIIEAADKRDEERKERPEFSLKEAAYVLTQDLDLATGEDTVQRITNAPEKAGIILYHVVKKLSSIFFNVQEEDLKAYAILFGIKRISTLAAHTIPPHTQTQPKKTEQNNQHPASSNVPITNSCENIISNWQSPWNQISPRPLAHHLLAQSIQAKWNNSWIGYPLEIELKYVYEKYTLEDKLSVWKEYFPVRGFADVLIMGRLFNQVMNDWNQKYLLIGIAAEINGNDNLAIHYSLRSKIPNRLFSMAVSKKIERSKIEGFIQWIADHYEPKDMWFIPILKAHMHSLYREDKKAFALIKKFINNHLINTSELVAEVERLCMHTRDLRWLQVIPKPKRSSFQRILYGELFIKELSLYSAQRYLARYDALFASCTTTEDKEKALKLMLAFCMRRGLPDVAINLAITLLDQIDTSNDLKYIALNILMRSEKEKIVMDRLATKSEGKFVCLMKAKIYLNPLSAYFSLSEGKRCLMKAEELFGKENLEIILLRLRLSCIESQDGLPEKLQQMRFDLMVGQNAIYCWNLPPLITSLGLRRYSASISSMIVYQAEIIRQMIENKLSLEERFAFASKIMGNQEIEELYAHFASPFGIEFGNLTKIWKTLDKSHQIQIILDLKPAPRNF